MPQYGSAFSKTSLTSIATLIQLYEPAANMRRGFLNDILVGTNVAPADQASEADLVRSEVIPSGGSAGTTAPYDVADVTALILTHLNGTSAVLTPVLLRIPFNMRATQRWVAQPGKPFVVPATANYGLALRGVVIGAAVTMDGSLGWEE